MQNSDPAASGFRAKASHALPGPGAAGRLPLSLHLHAPVARCQGEGFECKIFTQRHQGSGSRQVMHSQALGLLAAFLAAAIYTCLG